MKNLDPIRDKLGLFSDRALCVVNGRALLSLAKEGGYDSVKAFTKDAGLARTKVYQNEMKVSGDLRNRLLELLRIFNNALALYSNDEEAKNWLIAPNSRFYNMSPFMMAMAGRGKSVYELQEELLGNAQVG